MAKSKGARRSGNPQKNQKVEQKAWSPNGGVQRFLGLIRSTAAGAHDPLIAAGVTRHVKAMRADGADEQTAFRSAAAQHGLPFDDPDNLDLAAITKRVQERELSELTSARLIVPTPEAGAALMRAAHHLSTREAEKMWDAYKPTEPGAVVLPPTLFHRDGDLTSVLITWSTHDDQMPTIKADGQTRRAPAARVRLYADFRTVEPNDQLNANRRVRMNSKGKPPKIELYLQRDLLFTTAMAAQPDWVHTEQDYLRQVERMKDSPPGSFDVVVENLPRAVAALALRAIAEHPDAFAVEPAPKNTTTFMGEIDVVTAWPEQPVLALQTDLHQGAQWSSAAEIDRRLQRTIEQMAAYYSSEIGRATATAKVGIDVRMAEADLLAAAALDPEVSNPRGEVGARIQRVLDVHDLSPQANYQQVAQARIDAETDRWRRFDNPLFDAHTWVIDPAVTERIARSAQEQSGRNFDLNALPSAIGLLQLGTPLHTAHAPHHAHLLVDAPQSVRAIDVLGWEVVEGAEPPAVVLTAYERAGDVNDSARAEGNFNLLGISGANEPPLRTAYQELVELHPEGLRRTRIEDGTLITSLVAGYQGDQVNVPGIEFPGEDALFDFVATLARDLETERLGVHRTVASGEPLMDRGYRRRGAAGVLSYDPQSAFREGETGATFQRRTQIWLQGTALHRGSEEIRARAHLRGHPDAIARFTLPDGSHDLNGFADWYERRFGQDLRAEYDGRWVHRQRRGRRHAVTGLRELMEEQPGLASATAANEPSDALPKSSPQLRSNPGRLPQSGGPEHPGPRSHRPSGPAK
ncbi:MAG: hypothetical protein HOQ05_05990 [Corynebacteriales bacterium]|nr:hypothetical protein [Mycobacteriales bacterium]